MPDAGEQFRGDRTGLTTIVVRAEFKPTTRSVELSSEVRKMTGIADGSPKAAAQAEAVFAGEHDVENDEIEVGMIELSKSPAPSAAVSTVMS